MSSESTSGMLAENSQHSIASYKSTGGVGAGRKQSQSHIKNTSGGGSGIMSIPQLRRAFEHVQATAHKLIGGSNKLSKEAVSEFVKAWSAEFGRPLSPAAAESYLEHLQSMGPVSLSASKSQTRKRTLKGGASPVAAAAAPLDYKTEPGVYGTYGNFPAYVSGGFEVGVPRISQLEGWGHIDTTPRVPETIGSNQAGGSRTSSSEPQGRKKRAANKTRRLTAGRKKGGGQLILNTNPTSVFKDGVSYWHGQALPASPSPIDVGPRLVL